jgi:hypothetical protein
MLAGVVQPMDLPRSKKVRISRGARALVTTFKFIATLIWIAAIIVLLVALSTDLGLSLPSEFRVLVAAFAGDNILLTGITWLIMGFVVFGIGELIRLLNIVRRNTRL